MEKKFCEDLLAVVPEDITSLLKTASDQLAALNSPKVKKRLDQLNNVMWEAHEAHRRAVVLGNEGDIQAAEDALKKASDLRNVFKDRAAGLKTKLEIVINSLATLSVLSGSEFDRRVERAKSEIELAKKLFLDHIAK